MKPPDHDTSNASRDARWSGGSARILLVGADTTLQQRIIEAIAHRPYRCQCVATVDEARSILSRKRFEVMLLDCDSIADEWKPFLARFSESSVQMKTIITTAVDSPATTVQAMRCGAVDLVNTTRELSELVDRVDVALAHSRRQQQQHARLMRLKKVCRELNSARREVTDQVDSLCQELVTAYQDVAEQVSEASMTTELRTLLRQELDVEDLLRTTLEYMLTKTGPTNAAVFLPDGTGYYNLGAYVNYDCPRESIAMLLDHLCSAICPQMEDEREIVFFDDAADFARWIGMEPGILDQTQVIAFTCHRDDECLAVCVLFRSHNTPFEDELAGTLHLMRTIFAEQLARVIRIYNRMESSWPSEARDDELDVDDFGFGYGDSGGIAA